MKMNFTKADIRIENRKNGVQPAMFIFEDGKVYMVTITPDHQFIVSDEGLIGEKYDETGKYCGE